MKPSALGPNPAYRVRQGDQVVVLAWSNTAVTLSGIARVQYDDGRNEELVISSFASGSARSLVSAGSDRSVRSDGYVVEFALIAEGTPPAQRGQCYIQALILYSNDVNVKNTKQIISAGYCYAGHFPTLGEIVEPGPAGGHGYIYIFTGANPAAGSLPSDTQPAGTIWRLLAYQVPLVTDGTVGNRAFLLTANSGTYRLLHVNLNTQAASLTRGWAWLPGTDLSTTVGGSFVDGASTFLASYTLDLKEFTLGGMLYELLDSGTLAHTGGDDFGAPSLTVEEWVMPN